MSNTVSRLEELPAVALEPAEAAELYRQMGLSVSDLPIYRSVGVGLIRLSPGEAGPTHALAVLTPLGGKVGVTLYSLTPRAVEGLQADLKRVALSFLKVVADPPASA